MCTRKSIMGKSSVFPHLPHDISQPTPYHLLTARCDSRTLRDEMSSAAILRPARSRSEACVRSGVEERPTWEAEFGGEIEVRSKNQVSGAVAGVQAMEQPLVFFSRRERIRED